MGELPSVTFPSRSHGPLIGGTIHAEGDRKQATTGQASEQSDGAGSPNGGEGRDDVPLWDRQ